MKFTSNRFFVAAFTLLFSFFCTAAYAAEVMSVEALQYPAWLDSQGQSVPLRPGQAVKVGSDVRTGEGGKVWLTMADGARVKLGENATMSLKSGVIESAPKKASTAQPSNTQAAAAPAGKAGSVKYVRAAFNVVTGAFRYTTAKIETLWERQIDVGLGNVATIGIRGTDLWGQVGTDDQFVVLLEGDINVTPADGSASTNMNKPLDIYKAQAKQKSKVDMAAVQSLAPETELDFGTGVMTLDGDNRLQLASYPSQSGARAMVDRLAKQGLAAELESANVGGQVWHRVVVAQLDTRGDARALVPRLPQDAAIGSPWVR